MLPKLHRLTADKDFTKVFKGGRSFHGDGISIRVAPNQVGESRFAFVVSAKVSKKAVVRNRLRRRMREAVRKMLGGVVKGRDIVVMTKPQAAELTFDEVSRTLESLLKKARLLDL